MHEASLVKSLLAIIEEQKKLHGFARVASMTLSVGRLGCVEPEALRFAFDVLSKETVAEGAALTFDIQPIVVNCLGCAEDSRVEAFPDDCPRCGCPDVVVVEGMEELRLVEMDVE